MTNKRFPAAKQLKTTLDHLIPGIHVAYRGFVGFSFAEPQKLHPQETVAKRALEKSRELQLFFLKESGEKLPRLYFQTGKGLEAHTMSFLYDAKQASTSAGLVLVPTIYHGLPAEAALDGVIQKENGTRYVRPMHGAGHHK